LANAGDYEAKIRRMVMKSMIMDESEARMSEDKRVFKKQLAFASAGSYDGSEASLKEVAAGSSIGSDHGQDDERRRGKLLEIQKNQRNLGLLSGVLARNQEQLQALKSLEKAGRELGESRSREMELSGRLRALEQERDQLSQRLRSCNEACAPEGKGPF
jgi:chromosome segregation ATPase